jgi:hypothetical protein
MAVTAALPSLIFASPCFFLVYKYSVNNTKKSAVKQTNNDLPPSLKADCNMQRKAQ